MEIEGAQNSNAALDLLELRARVHQLEEIVNAGPSVAFAWVLETGWPVKFVSRSVEQFGYSTEDFLSGRIKYSDIVYPDDFARVENEVKQYLDSNTYRFYQRYRVKTASGEVRWVSDWTRVTRPGNGEPGRAQGIILDITDNVALEERAQRYLRIAGNIFVALDCSGKVTALNEMAEQVTGAPREDILGCDWIESFVPQEERTAIREKFEDIINSVNTDNIGEFENDILARDGRRHTIHWYYSFGRNIEGDLKDVIAFGADVTEQRKAEKRTRELAKMPGENPNPVLRVDNNGDVLSANDVANDLIDTLSLSDAISWQSWRELVDLAKVAVKQMQMQIIVAERTYLFEVVPLPSEGYTNLYGIDVTDRVHATNAFKDTLKKTIHVLSSVLEARDPYTAGHEQRVAEIAAIIGKGMDLDAHSLEGLELAATIHDVGKIRVPAEILSKPTKLTTPEYEIIKEHPSVGASFIRSIEFDWPIADMVEQHHERFDGSGYPHGIAGEHILLEARIIGVADTLEAMASHRPYRPGLGLEKATAEIRDGAGTRYDPKVAEVCLQLIQDGKISL